MIWYGIGKHKTFSMDGFGHVDISGAKHIRFEIWRVVYFMIIQQSKT